MNPLGENPTSFSAAAASHAKPRQQSQLTQELSIDDFPALGGGPSASSLASAGPPATSFFRPSAGPAPSLLGPAKGQTDVLFPPLSASMQPSATAKPFALAASDFPSLGKGAKEEPPSVFGTGGGGGPRLGFVSSLVSPAPGSSLSGTPSKTLPQEDEEDRFGLTGQQQEGASGWGAVRPSDSMMGQGLLASSNTNTLSSVIHQQQQQQVPSVAHNIELKGLVNGNAPPAPTAANTSSTPTNANLIQDRYGLLGLIDVIRMTNEDLSTLALGIDLAGLGLNLNDSERLYPMFMSPFSDTPTAHSDPPEYFSPPSCYTQIPSVQLSITRMSTLTEETLFYIFYSFPRDASQEAAAQELYSRGWRYHKELRLWLSKDPLVETIKGPGCERGVYVFFDPSAWSRVKKEWVLYHDQVEERGPSATSSSTDTDNRKEDPSSDPGSGSGPASGDNNTSAREDDLFKGNSSSSTEDPAHRAQGNHQAGGATFSKRNNVTGFPPQDFGMDHRSLGLYSLSSSSSSLAFTSWASPLQTSLPLGQVAVGR